MKELSRDEIRAIAEDIIIDHAFGVEFLSVTEMYDELSHEDCILIYKTIMGANVKVIWDE